MLRSVGKQSGEFVESGPKKKCEAIRWEGFAGNEGIDAETCAADAVCMKMQTVSTLVRRRSRECI